MGSGVLDRNTLRPCPRPRILVSLVPVTVIQRSSQLYHLSVRCLPLFAPRRVLFAGVDSEIEPWLLGFLLSDERMTCLERQYEYRRPAH